MCEYEDFTYYKHILPSNFEKKIIFVGAVRENSEINSNLLTLFWYPTTPMSIYIYIYRDQNMAPNLLRYHHRDNKYMC